MPIMIERVNIIWNKNLKEECLQCKHDWILLYSTKENNHMTKLASSPSAFRVSNPCVCCTLLRGNKVALSGCENQSWNSVCASKFPEVIRSPAAGKQTVVPFSPRQRN
ncbi:ubiquitin carboxyl-terminal hydrolase 49 [Platysternon megacephalum]|uniref:Ubiquitin carboxyl-terminal hydrolase 49 n=1 Tax=Platysternon megacephalum TaxID=55544 RepID=A0A4D9E3N9_9SAUR|nr:ubiquitin carboxyl-terminal hydrolase 49 [Platysternon megacephalum]